MDILAEKIPHRLKELLKIAEKQADSRASISVEFIMKKIKFLLQRPTLNWFPLMQRPCSAGADVRANISENIVIQPGMPALIPTGLKMAVAGQF